MFITKYSAVLALFALHAPLALSATPDGPNQTFVAMLMPVDNSTHVNGTAAVFIGTNGSLAYTGLLDNVEDNLLPGNCTAADGCGVHIYDGIGCGSAAEWGGHFYVSPVTTDPWASQKYTSDEMGQARFCGQVVIGSTNVSGKPFIVHNSSGMVVACGILMSPPASQVVEADLMPFGGSAVTGTMTVYNPGQGTVYLYGALMDLQPNLLSFMKGGLDCNDTLGCGVHIHAGNSCATEESQGGHYYNSDMLTIDPWLLVGYEQTDGQGDSQYCAAVTIDETDVLGHPAVVHSNNGSRVACGILGQTTTATTSGGGVTSLASWASQMLAVTIALIAVMISASF